MGSSRNIRLVGTLAAIVVVAGAGSVAGASIPDSNGVVHGCYGKTGGALRVVDTAKGEVCRAAELALTWNQKGPTGSNGAKGATGAAGPTGPAGSAIVARVRSIGPQDTTETLASYPVTGASWMQAANEVDTLSGEIDFTAPSFGDCALYSQAQGQIVPPGALGVVVYVDGSSVGNFSSTSQQPGGTEALAWVTNPLFEPESATSHTVAVQIDDTCEAPTLQDLQHFTIDSIAIDVQAAH